MKAKAFLYAAAVAAVSVSCTREAEESGLLKSGIDLEITAKWAEEKDADSRTVLQEDGTSIWWTPNEEINAFFGSRFAGRFTSTNTATAATATFQGTLNVLVGTIEEENDLSEYWAVYPYSASNTCDGHSVTLTVASEQTASAGSFADKFFPAVANSKTLELAFYNVCGGARFSVTQKGVTKVIFKSNDGSPMAGKVKVGFGDDNKPQILEITEPVDSVVVSAPEGGFVPGTNYFAAMLPQTHAEGITIILRTQDKKATRILANAVTVNRSSFGILDDVDSGLEYVDDEAQPSPDPDDFIQFEDPIAKYACVEKFDTNGDGEVSYAEAAAATSLKGLFKDWSNVTHFDEIKYFTGITSTEGVFSGLINLESIVIPDFITTLGDFKDCAALTIVTLPDSITKFPQECFMNCSSLKFIDIPTQVTSIPKYCFSGCSSLSSVSGLTGIKSIQDYAFSRCVSLISVEFSAALKTIKDGAFSGCKKLESVTLSSNVESFPGKIFYNCSSLAYILFPDNLATIGSLAFYGCPFEQINSTIILPATVSSIGSRAFTCLRHLVIPSSTAVSISSDAFGRYSNTNLYVPADKVEMYKRRTNWTPYASMIHSITDYPMKPTYVLPDAVDLGLSVKWASWNLGASAPEEYGAVFAWGEVTPGPREWATSYKWSNGSTTELTKYCNKSSYGYNGYTDSRIILDNEDDAAHINLGGNWRMPTDAEWSELLSNCTHTWTIVNGTNGYLISNNGNSIFLPAAGLRDSEIEPGHSGYYWSSTLYTTNPWGARRVYFSSSSITRLGYNDYYYGRPFAFSIRPVCCD